ncbi:hypothetical protein [Magnetovibrio blakemorei]|uniref:PAS domain-containing protein n=1 Tax=Magnetovibrio blakemorei TaxID=28181 RepID=A0A1E5Q8W5_9PROT|nr:hypothetical protein [Magnetovibrio blakemorei]OEJ67903.1 hypothetical protein BEN30_07850 [Magnetovibrio blakemorei]
MTSTPPEILREICPLLDLGVIYDDLLRNTVLGWRALHQATGKLPVWNMGFALQHASVVSSSTLYNLRGDEIYLSMIGDQCREYIGLQYSKGALYDLIPKANADDVKMRLHDCARHGVPTYCQKTMSWSNDKAHLKYEAVFLPFADGNSADSSWCFVPKFFYMGDEEDL